jgi:hypothetical protein
MLRRTILTALLGIGLTAGLTMTPANTDAHPPVERFHQRVEFRHPVEFHHGVEVVVMRHGCWEWYGTYGDRFEAERVANHLRCDGRAVEIRG